LAENQQVVEKGLKNFQSGLNCAQSVLLALYQHIEPRAQNDLIPKIASAFGGGIGRCGSVCGALSGSIMAVGIKYGSNEVDREKLMKLYAHAAKLYKQFENEHGTTMCRDLVKYDLSNPEEAAKARQEKVFEKVCVNFLKTAITSFLELEK